LGKTFSMGSEVAMHLTQRYPSWWNGKVFNRPIQAAGASETALLTRDGMQRILLGWPALPLGHGAIPKDAIVETIRSKHGPAELFEMLRIRHGGGGDVQAGESVFYLRSYDQGRARIQAMELDLFWFDEEPDLDYYMEGLTRTNNTLGPVVLTFTPLKGMSEVVARFLLEEHPDRSDTNMTIDDVEHYTEEQREKIISQYKAHERDARTKGVPILGSGRVFPVEEALIEEPAIEIPDHWPRIAAMDFGWDHPTAVVWGAWDRDTDTVHIYDAYRLREQPPAVHGSAIKARGEWIPVAWPHDGNNDTAAGPQLAKQYRDLGVQMLPKHAQFVDTSHDNKEDNSKSSKMSVEAGVSALLTRMTEGRLKVAKHLNDWWEEFRLYHRKDGKIVSERDDLMSATRYLEMSLDKAITPPIKRSSLRNRPARNWRI
jgi:phage terminase large subunit-like protein